MKRRQRSEHSPTRLYRDRERGILAGVCAGLAEYFGFNLLVLRIIVIALAIPFFMVVVVGYILLALLIPARPADLYVSEAEESFWRDVKRHPGDSVGRLRHRLRGVEQRLQKMEAWVTSPHFEIDREINKR